MNWSRAKTILIITFAVLNIVLYLNVLSINKPVKPTASEAELSSVYSILSYNNIKVNTDIPRQSIKMPLLKVERQNYKESYVIKNFIKDRQYVRYSDNKYTVYKFNNKVVKTGIGYLYFKDADNRYKNMDKIRKEQYIKNFISVYKLNEPNTVLNETYNDEEVIMRYTEIYKGYFVDMGYMEAKIDKNGFQFEKSWLKPIAMEINQKDIISASNALLKLVEIKDRNTPVVVNEIKLGYYFNWADAQTGEAVPVWRITTTGGKKHYINAYTGNIESR